MAERQLSGNTPMTDAPAEEGRSHERHACDLAGSCGPVSSWNRPETRWGGSITNISLGGVRLRLPRRFEPGSGLAIELPEPEGAGSCVVFAQVVHARPDGEGFWELGCRFVSELGEDEFCRLLYTPPHLASFSEHAPAGGQVSAVTPSQLAAAPESSEQRSHHRHPSLDSNVLRLAIRPAFGGRPALLVDVSAGGVGLLLDRPLDAGDILAVELGGPDGGEAPRLAQVRHCRPCPTPADAPWLTRPSSLTTFCRRLFGLATPAPRGEAWVIGCRFTRPLDSAELEGLLALCRPCRAGD